MEFLLDQGTLCSSKQICSPHHHSSKIICITISVKIYFLHLHESRANFFFYFLIENMYQIVK